MFLAGFSEGAQLTAYMQLAKLTYALGATIVMDGFPLPPLVDMRGGSRAAARKNASYYGADMRWMIWHGEADPIFPCDCNKAPKVLKSMSVILVSPPWVSPAGHEPRPQCFGKAARQQALPFS